MTVEEIKEYIDKQQEKLGNSDPYEEYAWYDISAELTQIRSMLDELEQPIEIDTKKYFEQIDKLVDKEMAQYLKDQMKKALKKEIEKGYRKRRITNDTTSNSDRHNRR